LVRILSDIGVTDISQREVNFQDGLLHAKPQNPKTPKPLNNENLNLIYLKMEKDQENIAI
jgi:predicted component of type VI protein secretion system